MSGRARKSRRLEVPSAPTIAAAGLAVLAATGFWACRASEGGSEAVPAAAAAATAGAVRREPGLDVLLITVDTLRVDALGSYGRPGAGTPWMDRLAAAGVRFEGAHAHNVLTLPSHANILSGLYPQEHGVRDNSGFRFPEGPATLAGVLSAAGYRTGAFVSAFPLDARFGLDRGFDVYEDSFTDARSRQAFFEQERAGTETVALARRWLAAADGRPSFCWVHLYEPHFPYAPPEPFAGRSPGGGQTQHGREDPYQGEVAATDAALAPLLEPILAAGDAGRTLVVLTSDHGEALGEHGEATHGIFAYEATLAVPLILYRPRLFAPRVVVAPARHVDLMPTILDALSVPVPGGLRGRSLLAAAAGRPDGEAPATYFEALSGQLNRGWAPLYGVLDGEEKYVDLPIPELYDLGDDPREQRNLAEKQPRRLAALREVLAPLRAIDPGSAPSPESAEVRERLESLGYLSSGASTVKESYGEDDDPKRLIALEQVFREVADLHARGDLDGAARRARELVRRRPGMRVALLDLAQLERQRGRFDAAVEALRQALALAPEDPATLALLAASLTQAGSQGEAVAVTSAHAESPLPDVDVLLARGLAFARLERPRDALATFEKARRIDPENPRVDVHVGTLYLMAGRREEARRAYSQALALNPLTASAHVSLAVMAAEDGLPDEALAHWRSAVESDPSQHAKLLAIGGRLWSAGRRDEARPLLELFADSAPAADYGEEIGRVRRLLAGARGPS